MISSQKPANENMEPTETTPQPDTANSAPVSDVTVPAEASRASQLQEEIDRLTEELSRARDQWVRAVAETENIRKRALREQEDTSRYAITAFAHDMVSVLENLKRACESITSGSELAEDTRDDGKLLETLGEGVGLTMQELLNIFQKHGINRIDPQGHKFDHNLHQAVVQVERNDVPPGTVVQVVQAGYVIHDRLLRPAMVAVSKQGETPKKVDTSA